MRASLDHVAITVADREITAHFYDVFFGFSQRIHEDDHLLIVTGEGGGLLAFSEGPLTARTVRTTHFGFQLSAADDVRALRERFAEANVEEAEWQETGPTRVQVFDPDGYRVEAYAF